MNRAIESLAIGTRERYPESELEETNFETADIVNEAKIELRMGVVELIYQSILKKVRELKKEEMNFSPTIISQARFSIVENKNGNFVNPNYLLNEIARTLTNEFIAYKVTYEDNYEKQICSIEITDGMLKESVFLNDFDVIGIRTPARNNIIDLKKEQEAMLNIASSAADSNNWAVLCLNSRLDAPEELFFLKKNKLGKQCQIDTSAETFGEDCQIGAKATPFIMALLSSSYDYNFGNRVVDMTSVNEPIANAKYPKSIEEWSEMLADAPVGSGSQKKSGVPFWRHILSKPNYDLVWNEIANINLNYWPNFGPTEFITNELRCLNTPSFEQLFLPEAILMGLLAEKQEFLKEFADITSNNLEYFIKRARLGDIGYHEIDPMRRYLIKMLQMAKKGLLKRGFGEEIFLEQAFKIIDTGETLSKKILRIYQDAKYREEDWRLAIVEYTKWKPALEVKLNMRISENRV